MFFKDDYDNINIGDVDMIGDNNFIDDIGTNKKDEQINVSGRKKTSIFVKLFMAFCFLFLVYFIIYNLEDRNTHLSFRELVEDNCMNTDFIVDEESENHLKIKYNGEMIAEMKYYNDTEYLHYDVKKLEVVNDSIRKFHPLPEVNKILDELGMQDYLMSYEHANYYLISYRADLDDSLINQLQNIFKQVKSKKLLQEGIITKDMSSLYKKDMTKNIKSLFEEKNREILIEMVLNQGTVSERERLYSIFSKIDCFYEECKVWKQCNDLIEKKEWNDSQLKKEVTNRLKKQVFTLGNYKVGKDLLPGIYVCIDENYKNANSFHANKMSFSLKHNVYQQWYQNVIVVLENGDDISVDRYTKLYHLDNTPQLQTTEYPRGVFYVGKHISEGTYEVEALSDYYACYYWIVDSSKINELLSLNEKTLYSQLEKYNGHIIKKGKNELLKLDRDQILVMMDGNLKKK